LKKQDRHRAKFQILNLANISVETFDNIALLYEGFVIYSEIVWIDFEGVCNSETNDLFVSFHAGRCKLQFSVYVRMP